MKGRIHDYYRETDEWVETDSMGKLICKTASVPIAIDVNTIWYIKVDPRVPQFLNISTMKSVKKKDMNHQRDLYASALFCNQIFVMGGADMFGNVTSCCEVYDIA